MDAAPRFVVRFHQLMQNSQELGSNDEHMISQVSFSLEVDGKAKGEFSATLKQTVGSEFNDANIEVSPPDGYDGDFDHNGFSDVARRYFTSSIGQQGRGIRIEGRPANLTMLNNRFDREAEYKF
jgi:hypothetical protein